MVREGLQKYNFLNEEDVKTCYCDAVLAVVENIRNGKFEGKASLKTYLTQIFFNKCVDAKRKTATNKSEVHQVVDIAEAQYLHTNVQDALRTLIAQNDYDRLLAKLEKIGDPCQSLLLARGNDYSYTEIAEMQGYKSPEVVRTTVGRCREKVLKLPNT